MAEEKAALDVRKSAALVAKTSQDVKVNEKAIADLADKLYLPWKSGKFKLSHWRTRNELHPSIANEKALAWIFVVDTLNFSFWHDTPTSAFVVEYHGKRYSGYWSLCAVVNRALEEGIPMTSAEYLAQLTMEQLRHIFRPVEGAGEVALVEERLRVLREAGQVLKEKFGGSFANCVRGCEGSAQKLLDTVCLHFSSYRDEALWQGERIRLLKRAQILVADTWACFEGRGLGRFDDIDVITMFADYRVPQSLVYFGLIRYSEELLKVLSSPDHLLANGDRMEVEIRGCSIHAVELLVQAMRARWREEKEKQGMNQEEGEDHPLNGIVIDFYLWDYAKAYASDMDHIPIHHTRSIYY